MTERGGPVGERDWRAISRVVGVVVLLALLLTFMAVNTTKVEVDFVLADVRAPLFVVLFVTTALGAVLGLLAQRIRRR